MPRLRVLAGSDPSNVRDISGLVNSDNAFAIKSPFFEGTIAVYIKGFTTPEGKVTDAEYFKKEGRRERISWSIQMQGRFLQKYSADDIMFGNIFDKTLNLPWGSGAALKYLKFRDPSVEHDLTSPTKPWALSPFITTMPHLKHIHLITSPSPTERSDDSDLSDTYADADARVVINEPSLEHPLFPSEDPISDDTSQLYLSLRDDAGSDSSSLSPIAASSTASIQSTLSSTSTVSRLSSRIATSTLRMPQLKRGKKKTLTELQTADQRKAYFMNPENRKDIEFGPEDLLTADFCHGTLKFHPNLSLDLPYGISFDLMRFWDGQPVRFVCCERGKDGKLFGNIFWCASIEPAERAEMLAKNTPANANGVH